MKEPEYLLKIDNTPDIQGALELTASKKYSKLITSLVNDKRKADLLNNESQKYLARSPLVLPSSAYLNEIVPLIKISSDLESIDEDVRKNYEMKLLQEFNYVNHVKNLGVHYIQASCKPETLGIFLQSQLEKTVFNIYVVEIPLQSYKNYSKLFLENSKENDNDSPWEYWNALHKFTNYSKRIEVALVLSDIPDNELELYRWLGEPVNMLVIPHFCFMTNKSNFPILSKRQQEVVRMFMQYTSCSVAIEPKFLSDHKIQSYLEYIRYQNNTFVDHSDVEQKDLLKYPLQPLHDNLDYGTYETFERDPAKYILYQEAIESALMDMIPEKEIETRKAIILLVGAGRGPLIRAALNAAENTNRKVKIIAVEKNPVAILTLSSLIRELWSDKDITLIEKDMRTIELEEHADILVSELLGSFGDNELSPECLDGVQHLLKPTGISIPANSKSYVQPIMTKRTFSAFLDLDESRYKEHTENNWLIYLTNVFHIDDVKELFTFVHPNKHVPIDNSRYGKLTFKASINCVFHGFAGYFTSELYKDIDISIHPNTHTKGMASWYSMYFPIEKPIQLKKGEEITFEMWRKVDPAKVWYEWKVSTLTMESKIHNENGEVWPIYLS